MDNVPGNLQFYTDKYFTRTRKLLEKIDYNPEIALKVFARNGGTIPDGMNEAVINLFEEYAPEASIYARTKSQYQNSTDPLFVIKGRAQNIVELETIYLGIISDYLTKAAGIDVEQQINKAGKRVNKLTDIYNEVGVPFIYFGARHYHWQYDRKLAKQALNNGATQTSTDNGSEVIGESGVGTTPHFLTLLLAKKYSKQRATKATAALFDRYMDDDIPRVTLVDTFNQELSDSIAVCDHMDKLYDDWEHTFRVDTCGENKMAASDLRGTSLDSAFAGLKHKVSSDFPDDTEYWDGTGVRIKPLIGYKAALDSYAMFGGLEGGVPEVFLSSGFANPKKARAFVKAAKWYKKEVGSELFSGVGAGGITQNAVHSTADVYKVSGEYIAKTGREINEPLIKRDDLKKIY